MKCIYLTAKIILLAALSTGIGCSKKGDVSQDEYDKLAKKYKQQLKDYSALDKKEGYSDSDDLLIETTNLLAILNNKAIEVRKQTRKIREGLSEYKDAASLKSDLIKLDRMVQDALADVSKLQRQTSLKNMNIVKSHSNPLVQIIRASIASKSVGTLSGIRDLFSSQYNDLVNTVNLRISELPPGVEPADIDPAREGNLVPEHVNPVVASYDDGGRVTGIARDSVSGSPVKNAFVGFKKRAESTDYFYETTTNNQGKYQSPFLMPGTYYVDIRRDGYINVSNQTVSVNRGQESRENLSMSEPLEDGVYRVTLSWTNRKQNAVKDVDSYLIIPGTSRPLSYKTKRKMYHGAHLDRDDTDWVGPETVTIKDLKSGTYIYYVNNYDARANKTALGNSDIRVKLYKGQELLRSFSVPQGRGITYEVFRIVNGEVKITARFNDTLEKH